MRSIIVLCRALSEVWDLIGTLQSRGNNNALLALLRRWSPAPAAWSTRSRSPGAGAASGRGRWRGRGEGEAGVGVVAAVGLALAGHLAGARAVQLQLKHKHGVIWPAQCRQGPTILCWPSWVPGLVRGEARGC